MRSVFMKASVAMLLLAGAAAAAGPKPTAEYVIETYVKAAGGAKVLAAIQTSTIAGNLAEESTGKTGSYSRIAKAPNRLYSEIVIEPDREIEAYNGMSAWGQAASAEAHTLTGAEAKEAESESQYSGTTDWWI